MKEEDIVIDDLFEGEETTFVQAKKDLRFANYIIDALICNVVGSGVGFILEESTLYLNEVSMLLTSIVIPLFISVFYYIFFEHYSNGQTLGKMVTGTRVWSKNGKKPSLSQIIGRSLCRFIPFEILSYLGQSKRGLHDNLSGTMVISIKQSKLPKEEDELIF